MESDDYNLFQLSADALTGISAIPPWSITAHLVVGLLVVTLQQTLRNSHQFSSWNEYLCTLLWVCWTLEASVIGFASSSNNTLLALFLRMLLWPLLSYDACVNPLNSVYLAVQEKSVRGIPRCLVIQLLAMVSGIAYSILTWRFLGAWVSDTHFHFMGSTANPFLNVGAAEGFLLELGMAFFMYLPRLVMGTSFTSTFVSATWTCVMIILLEHTTGAFMNPLIALSSSLVWHTGSLSAVGVVEMVVVYWLAPVIGTVLAATMDTWISRKPHKPHIS